MRKSNQKKKPIVGHNCNGKSLANSMIGSSMNFINRQISGEGQRKTGVTFDGEAIKAFSQWKWQWNLTIEIDISYPDKENKTVRLIHDVAHFKTIFELEDVVFDLQTREVIEEKGVFVERRWRAEITGSPV